jgi:hypothetical protein
MSPDDNSLQVNNHMCNTSHTIDTFAFVQGFGYRFSFSLWDWDCPGPWLPDKVPAEICKQILNSNYETADRSCGGENRHRRHYLG